MGDRGERGYWGYTDKEIRVMRSKARREWLNSLARNHSKRKR